VKRSWSRAAAITIGKSGAVHPDRDKGWDSTLFKEGLFFSKDAIVTFGGDYALQSRRGHYDRRAARDRTRAAYRARNPVDQILKPAAESSEKRPLLRLGIEKEKTIMQMMHGGMFVWWAGWYFARGASRSRHCKVTQEATFATNARAC
jgi:hypothetical protein